MREKIRVGMGKSKTHASFLPSMLTDSARKIQTVHYLHRQQMHDLHGVSSTCPSSQSVTLKSKGQTILDMGNGGRGAKEQVQFEETIGK